MEQMHIVVPVKTPNVLPHQKIRDNPHVSSEEWEVLQETFNQKRKTEMQKRFVDALSNAAVRIFKYMGVPTECMLKHKLYNLELIKLSPDVTFLVICPPIELSCGLTPPGQREMLLQRADLVSVPTKAFELSQLYAYDRGSIKKCARLSLVLDLEIAAANHSHRESFSTLEIQSTKEHLHRLEQIRTDLFDFWKRKGWLLRVMTFSRNRCSDSGITIRSILNVEDPQSEPVEKKNDDQLVTPSYGVNSTMLFNYSPCRLSWPNNYRKEQTTTTTTELSKSDQQLNFVISKVGCTRTTDVDSSRRNSADAKYPQCLHASDESLNCYVDRCALCKSDETLSTSRPSFSPLPQRKRSKTLSARICSSKCVQCDSSSTSVDDNASNGSDSKVESRSTPVTCTVDNYTSKVDYQITNIESSLTGEIDKENFCVDDNVCIDSSQFGTIQVYVANETGAGNSICLRLHVTTLTTASEIIDLVVNQCNRNVLQNDGELCYNQLLNSKDFCLFAIFNNRGRCVPDNFRPLQLQNPWKKGRLFVRRTDDILTEIEQSQRVVHNI